MSKIKPTSILPYAKVRIPANQTAQSYNVTKALSTESPPKGEIKSDVLALMGAVASFKVHVREEAADSTASEPPRDNGSHLQSLLGAWQRRADPDTYGP